MHYHSVKKFAAPDSVRRARETRELLSRALPFSIVVPLQELRDEAVVVGNFTGMRVIQSLNGRSGINVTGQIAKRSQTEEGVS